MKLASNIEAKWFDTRYWRPLSHCLHLLSPAGRIMNKTSQHWTVCPRTQWLWRLRSPLLAALGGSRDSCVVFWFFSFVFFVRCYASLGGRESKLRQNEHDEAPAYLAPLATLFSWYFSLPLNPPRPPFTLYTHNSLYLLLLIRDRL